MLLLNSLQFNGDNLSLESQQNISYSFETISRGQFVWPGSHIKK